MLQHMLVFANAMDDIVWDDYGFDVQYTGQFDLLPPNNNLPIDWDISGNGTYSEVVDDDTDCDNDKRLTLVGGTGSSDYYLYTHSVAGRDWYDNVSNASGYTIKVRLKVITAGSTHGQVINVYDGTRNFQVRFNTANIHVTPYVFDGSPSDYTYTFDTTDAYHTYEFIVSGTSWEFKVDGSSITTKTLKSSTLTKKLEWGDPNLSNRGGTVHWDYFAYTTN